MVANRLNAVRTESDLESLLKVFIEGVAVMADEAVAATKILFELVTADRAKVLPAPSTSIMGARLFEVLPEHPIITIGTVVKLLGTTKPTATKAVEALFAAGVLVEATGRRHDRMFSYAAHIDLLHAGTD